MKGQLYVFSGPSGSGKSTIIRKLRERIKDLGYSISHTTRSPRKNEVNGVNYHFVDRETFNRMIEEESFVEWAVIYGDLYGTSVTGLREQLALGTDMVLDVDHQGAKNIRALFRKCAMIYILPPSLEVLEARLRDRATDEDEVIAERLKQAQDEIGNCGFYDCLIINDGLEKAVKEAEAVILSDRCRKSRVFPRIKEIFGL
jgi:guanylate kinase